MPSSNGNSYGSVSKDTSTANGHHNPESGEKTKLLVDDGQDDTASWENGTKKHRISPYLKWLLIAVVVAGGTGIATMIYRHFRTFQEPQDNGLNPTYRTGPLSNLDPVNDLGLYSFDRPLSSQPTVNRSTDASRQGTALPTNSWYQSLLLLSDDPKAQPSNLHRAYSIPYIVDPAGPVAGLRIYPHHVGSASNVIQAYVIESQGLTMGLATADGVSAPIRYQVELMTPLGITMSWVSQVNGPLFWVVIVSCLGTSWNEQWMQLTIFVPVLFYYAVEFSSFDDGVEGNAVCDIQVR